MPRAPQHRHGSVRQQPVLAERAEPGVGWLQLGVHHTGLDGTWIAVVGVPRGDLLCDQRLEVGAQLVNGAPIQQRRHQQVAVALKRVSLCDGEPAARGHKRESPPDSTARQTIYRATRNMPAPLAVRPAAAR